MSAQAVTFCDPAFTANRAAAVHRWVPWIAGFSKQFVADALAQYLNSKKETVLDPFAGVGTTLVESDLAGHEAMGFEINPYAAFAAQLKLRAHRIPLDRLRAAIGELRTHAHTVELNGATPQTVPPHGFRTRAPFYSPKVERKVLLLLDFIANEENKQVADLLRLAFASTMVDYSNYSYEPSLGRRAAVGRAAVDDHPVAIHVTGKLTQMADDAEWYRQARSRHLRRDGRVYRQSFFEGYERIEPGSVDLLVTSPPYANNYHYNRNTRPHLFWLGLCDSPAKLKRLEQQNFGTYWQRARERDPIALDPSISDHKIIRTLTKIRKRNTDRGIYGGEGWANYITTYLNDCVRFVDGMKWCLRPGATALIVIGNSIVQGVNVPTDQFLASIAKEHGLTLVDIHQPRAARVGNSIINSSVRTEPAGRSASLYEAIVEIRRP